MRAPFMPVINKAVVRGLRSVLNANEWAGPTPEVAQARKFLEDLVELFDVRGIEEHEVCLEPLLSLEELVRHHVKVHGPASFFGRVAAWTGARPVEGPMVQSATAPESDDLVASLRAQIAAMQKLHSESALEKKLAEAHQLLADRYDLIRKQEAQLEAAKAALEKGAELELRLAKLEADYVAERDGYERALDGADAREAESANLILAQAVIIVRELGMRVGRRGTRSDECG